MEMTFDEFTAKILTDSEASGWGDSEIPFTSHYLSYRITAKYKTTAVEIIHDT